MSIGYIEFFADVQNSWQGKTLEVSYLDAARELQTEKFLIAAISLEEKFGAVKFEVSPEEKTLGHNGRRIIKELLYPPTLEFSLRISSGMYQNKIKGKTDCAKGFDSLFINYTNCFGLRMGAFGYPIVDIKLV